VGIVARPGDHARPTATAARPRPADHRGSAPPCRTGGGRRAERPGLRDCRTAPVVAGPARCERRGLVPCRLCDRGAADCSTVRRNRPKGPPSPRRESPPRRVPVHGPGGRHPGGRCDRHRPARAATPASGPGHPGPRRAARRHVRAPAYPLRPWGGTGGSGAMTRCPRPAGVGPVCRPGPESAVIPCTSTAHGRRDPRPRVQAGPARSPAPGPRPRPAAGGPARVSALSVSGAAPDPGAAARRCRRWDRAEKRLPRGGRPGMLLTLH
jgi:hypothetical protein